MQLKEILYFLWTGFYGHIIIYLKQSLFQGQDILKSPWEYLKNAKFVASASILLFVGLGSWFFDAIIRQTFHLSEMYAYSTLISTPISVTIMFIVLWLSEKHLGDKINWTWCIIWLVGTAITMIASSMMIKR